MVFHHRVPGAISALAVIAVAAPAAAQFTPGQAIEYQSFGQWEPGTVVRMTPGNTQVVIRQAPTTFYPEGFERTYDLNQVRPRQPAAQAPAPAPGRAAGPPPAPGRAAGPAGGTPAIPQGTGLLNQQQILDYARQALGPQPFANPNRQQALDNIRDYIKTRGVNFQMSLDFSNQLGAIGANSVHISSAIGDNFGPNPTLQTYFGTFNLTSQVRGAQSVSQSGGRTVVTTTDAAARMGSIRINPDGTYVWNVQGDGRTIQGRWREATAAEKQTWEGGPAIWLLNARDGQDYQVRADRQPGYQGWIDIGQGMGRIAVQYGQPAGR